MNVDEFLIQFYDLFLENHSKKQRVSDILPKEIYKSKAFMFSLLDKLVYNGHIKAYEKRQGPIIEITD